MSGIEYVGDNNVRQILSSHRMLALIKTVELSAIQAVSPLHYAWFESAYTPTNYCRVAIRHTNGFFRPLWGVGAHALYGYSPPAGTKLTIWANVEVAGPVTAYIYDVPPAPPASGAGAELFDEAGNLAFSSLLKYMDVAGFGSGNMTATTPGPTSFTLGAAAYAICPMQEAIQITETGTWNSGGVWYTDFNDWVTWWRCDVGGATAKFVNLPADIVSSSFPGNKNHSFYSALIHRV